jgi:hypothetical protein
MGLLFECSVSPRAETQQRQAVVTTAVHELHACLLVACCATRPELPAWTNFIRKTAAVTVHEVAPLLPEFDLM